MTVQHKADQKVLVHAGRRVGQFAYIVAMGAETHTTVSSKS